MNSFNELNQILNCDYNTGTWWELYLHEASELVDCLDDESWNKLQINWAEKSIAWQIKLAEAAFGSDKFRAINLLVQMLKSNNLDVAIAAASSLVAKNYMWTPEESLRAPLENLLDAIQDDNRIIIEQLIANVGSEPTGI